MPHREQLVGLVLWVSGCIGMVRFHMHDAHGITLVSIVQHWCIVKLSEQRRRGAIGSRLKRTLGLPALTFFGVGMILGAGVYSVIGVATTRRWWKR